MSQITENNFDSTFEEKVCDKLIKEKYNVETQYSVED